MSKRTRRFEPVSVVHPNGVGLDIGAGERWACVPPDREAEAVKPFGTCTPDLQRLIRLRARTV